MDKKYTIQEVAKRLKVSQRTILREIQRGKIGVEKAGRRYLISEKSLSIYLGGGILDIDKKIENFLRDKKKEMVNLLQKMVALPSVGYKSGPEFQLAEFIQGKMQEFGVRCVLLREGEAIAIRASYGYADRGIVIDCPLDTAPIGNIDAWEHPPFGGVIMAGKMFGRGTADCKAGIVASIYALLALREFIDEEKVRLELVFDGGEQDGSYKGMEMVVKRGLYADAAIIGYAGDEFELAIGCRGYHRYTFKTIGKAAHTGSRYNLGVNSIEKMVDFIKEMYSVKLGRSKSKYFPFGQKLTFALIQGGREINIVPDECIARLDFRVTPEYSKKYTDQIIEQTINYLKKKDKNFNIEWSYDLGNEGYLIDDQEDIVKITNQGIKRVYGRKAKVVATGPSNIGTILGRQGIPAVIWGPRGGEVHSYNEYVEIDSILKTSQIYAATILDYFGIDKTF